MEMFLALLTIVYIFGSLSVLLECVLMLMTSTTDTFLTAKCLKKVIDVTKFENHFLNSTTDTQS